jgi:hypothetical protein
MWQPLGNVSFSALKVAFSYRPPSNFPFGHLVGLKAALATSFRAIDLSVPLTVKLPSLNSMSCSPAYKR